MISWNSLNVLNEVLTKVKVLELENTDRRLMRNRFAIDILRHQPYYDIKK